MIASSHRFHGRASLKPVYERGRTVRSSALALRYAANTRRGKYRAAVVVSKKVHKSAVARNRIRRRIYEIIRTELSADTPAYDLIVTVFSDKVTDLSPEALRNEVGGLLAQAQIVNKPAGS